MADYNYKITIQYDGTRYHGWQILNSSEGTIQGKLEAVISRILGYHIDVIGSGRTDAGVHAHGQVANFHTKDSIDEAAILSELNKYLPEDIAVTDIQKVDARFHARFSALEKTYRYRIHTCEAPNVFERKYLYKYTDKPLNIEEMRKAADLLEGMHDFKSFCGNKHMKKSTVRKISRIDIIEKENEIMIEYTGDGFLQNMVRILTGTLIEIGNGTRKSDDIVRILEARDREQAGYTAPASGLCLVEVFY